jgi:purine-nucleoside phosphorylase
MYEKIKETTEFLVSKGFVKPEAGIVLGTGLGGFTSAMKNCTEIKYQDIPHFSVSTVEGHEGKLIFGDFAGKKVVAMKGRFHFYEGYSSEELTFPIRVMKSLGIRYLILSNASGGVNPEFEVGDIMIINDHINLMTNPLIGPNDSRIGPRFPDMGEPYDHAMIDKAWEIGKKLGLRIHKGVYLGTSGPTFETPAEYRFMRIIGADTVGMSTVPEVITARHMGLPCFAVSIITDLGVPGKMTYITHEMVQKAAEKSEGFMTQLMIELISEI